MDDADSIDYKAMYERMVDELEQARIAILDLRRKQGMFGSVTGDAIRNWANRNYIVILAAIMLGTFLISSIQTILELLKNKPQQGEA